VPVRPRPGAQSRGVKRKAQRILSTDSFGRDSDAGSALKE